MAKLTAPMFSFGASGALADALVFGRWKGIDYARKYVIPANPNTAAQVTQRSHLTAAVAQWHTVGADALEGQDKLAWDRYAGVLGPMTGFNAFVKEWIDEEVAGGTPPGHFLDVNVTDPTAGAFDVDVDGEGLTTENVTLHLGNSKTFFPVTDTQAASSGVATFANVATGFAAGTLAYFYFDVGTPGTDYMRSGLYVATLT
jgi:hypothetical protein